MANIHTNAYRSHPLWHFFVIVGTHYNKYSHRCSQAPSTLTLFLSCVHTLWQIFTSMFIGPIYFNSFLYCVHTLWQIFSSMFIGPLYFCNWFLLSAHLMANIFINIHSSHLIYHSFIIAGTNYNKHSINVRKSHLLWQFFFAVCTPYNKYTHQCL